MSVSVTHQPVAGPNDPTKQVSKTVYEQPHVVIGLATVAETGAYADLTGLPTLGTAAAANVGDFDAAGVATAAVAAHVGLADPHTQYQKESEKDAANGYAGLSAGTKLAGTQQTYGSAANTACEGNDARLSDARTPTAHTQALSTITGTTLGSVVYVGAGPVLAEDNANFKWGTTAGQGLTLGAGTATTDVQALKITQTWNNGAQAFTSITHTITETAKANGSLAYKLLSGAAGTTYALSIANSGAIVTNAGVLIGGTGVIANVAEINYYSAGMTVVSGFPIGWSSSAATASTAADVAFSRISAGLVGVGIGTPASYAGGLKLTTLQVAGSGSGVATITAPAAAGTPTLTLPTTTGTLAIVSEVLQSTNAPLADVTVAANYSVFSDEEFLIADGKELLLEDNASLVIL